MIKVLILKRLIFLSYAILFTVPAYSALSIRDLDGDWSNGHEGVYDDVLDITWLADANIAKSNRFGFNYNVVTESGAMFWGIANDFVNAANQSNYLNHSGWRMPKSSPVNGTSFDLSFTYDGSTDWTSQPLLDTG